VILLVSPLASADTLTLTLDEAVALGLSNSSTLEAQRLTLQSAAARVAAARSAWYPSLTVGANWQHNFEQTQSTMTIPGVGTFSQFVQAKDPVTLSADLNQPITTFGRTKYAVRLAEQGLEQETVDLEESTRSLILEIKRAFYGYLLAEQVLDVHRETWSQRQESLDIAQARFQAGLIPEFERLQAESDLVSFRPTLIAAENQVRFALLAVKDLLGIKSDEEYEVELVGNLEPEEGSFDKDRLVRLALENNNDIEQYRINRQLAALQLELNKRQKRPIVSGFATYLLQSGYDAATGENLFFDADAWDGNLAAGLVVSMDLSSLFPWSGETAQVKESEFDLAALEETGESIRSGLRLNIENILLSLEEQTATIESTQKSIQLASTLYESALERYQQGLIPRNELRDAEVNLNNARLSYYNAVYTYKSAVFDLAGVVGKADLGDGENNLENPESDLEENL
jgi:outer membrane protein TolC